MPGAGLVDAARERGVRGFLVPAIRMDDADEVLALHARLARVDATRAARLDRVGGRAANR